MKFHERWIQCLQALVNIVETIEVSYVCHRDLPMGQEFPAGSSFPRRSIPCVMTFIYLFIKNSQEGRQMKFYQIKYKPSFPLYFNSRNYYW